MAHHVIRERFYSLRRIGSPPQRAKWNQAFWPTWTALMIYDAFNYVFFKKKLLLYT